MLGIYMSNEYIFGDESDQGLRQWPNVLYRREGSPIRTDGIPIYYDFDWHTEFGHDRSTFQNGTAICQTVSSLCPSGRRPAILLTVREDNDYPLVLTNGNEYILVVALHRLRETRPDAGATFFRDRININLSDVHSVEMTPEARRALVDLNIDVESIRRWSQIDPTHIEQLLAITGTGDNALRTAGSATMDEVIQSLESVAQVNPELLEALKTALSKITDESSRLEVLRELSEDRPGESGRLLEVAKGVLSILDEQSLASEKISSLFAHCRSNFLSHISVGARLIEYRRVLDELRTKVDQNTDTEHIYQSLLEKYPWLFGSEYSRLEDRRRWTRDENVDFMLRRTTDDYLEIIEIKTPMDQELFRHDNDHDSYYQSTPLAKVIGQVIGYIEEIDRNRDNIHASDRVDPLKIRARIIIGRDGDENQREALRNLNSHLHRIEVLTFDQLIRIGERVIGVFEDEISTDSDVADSSNHSSGDIDEDDQRIGIEN